MADENLSSDVVCNFVYDIDLKIIPLFYRMSSFFMPFDINLG